MTTDVASTAPQEMPLINFNTYDRTPSLTPAEQAALACVCNRRYSMVHAHEEAVLSRLLTPLKAY